tara:strand:+ start:397 stop:1947 length:1551 start_codon:yes stop_codon:yes gene_type:complete
MPSDPYEAQRWQESARRRRQLDGTWREDLRRRLGDQLGSVRASAWGPISLALNPFASIIRELSVLYDHSPEVLHDDVPEAAIAILADQAGLWPMMARVQQYVLGQRECFVRVDISGSLLRYRPVFVDLVQARALPERPDQPVMLREWRLRLDPEGKEEIWTVDCFSIVGDPYYRVHRAGKADELGEDLTEHYLGQRFDGDAYPYRWENGSPYLPYVLYHAERTGDRLFDPYRLSELAEGSLDCAVLHQMLIHTYRDASWPQRWIVNLEPASMDVQGTSAARREVVTDPASLLVLRQARELEDAGQAMVGQWQPGGDVQKLEETLSNIVARLAQEAGVPASDIQRLGGTARSGVAISLSNEGKRAAQRRYRSSFRTSDEELISKSAALVNRLNGTDLPERSYRVIYHEVPLSPEERKARREDVFALLDKGLLSRLQAYTRLNPGISRRQAGRALDGIAGRGEAIDEIRAAREEIDDLVADLDEANANRMKLVDSSLGHSLRLLEQQLNEDVAEAGGY